MLNVTNENLIEVDQKDDEHSHLVDMVDGDHELLYLDSVMLSLFDKDEDENVIDA